jgi:hypothetical protein
MGLYIVSAYYFQNVESFKTRLESDYNCYIISTNKLILMPVYYILRVFHFTNFISHEMFKT